MHVYIFTDGRQEGPLTLEEVNNRVRYGSLSVASTLAWYEGCSDWVPLSLFPGIGKLGETVPPPLPVTPAQPPQADTRAGRGSNWRDEHPTLLYLFFGSIIALAILVAVLVFAFGGRVAPDRDNGLLPITTAEPSVSPAPDVIPASTPEVVASGTPEVTPVDIFVPSPASTPAPDAKELNRIGKTYMDGDGVDTDLPTAFRYFQKAADMGDALGEERVGFMYLRGMGVDEDDASAAEWYRKSADQGNVTSEFNLGVLYEKGEGVDQDYAKAVFWYKKAADNGDADAANNLGALYEAGKGMDTDYAMAVQMYRRSAEGGFSSGEANLGAMYYYGKGVNKDYRQAVKWLSKAALQGELKGQNLLAICYLEGTGVPRNLVEGLAWLHVAADSGDDDSKQAEQKAEADIGADTMRQVVKRAGELSDEMKNQGQDDTSGAGTADSATQTATPDPNDKSVKLEKLGEKYLNGDGVTGNDATAADYFQQAAAIGSIEAETYLAELYDTGQGVEKNYTSAYEWYAKAAETGNAQALYGLGTMYENGHGVEQDYKVAFKIYQKAADLGNASAQAHLGKCYYEGLGVEVDNAAALKWFQKAAAAGDELAEFLLGTMYKDGAGVDKDYLQAGEWFRKAAEQGNADAEHYLGIMYGVGWGVEKDYAKAAEWLRKAAEQGNADAQYNLGNIYAQGLGMDRDYAEAVRWYQMAAGNGSAPAQNSLANLYENGQGVDKDMNAALRWYAEAARNGYDKAEFNLGSMYYQGEGVAQDYKEALKWLTKSARRGFAKSQAVVGLMYYCGQGVPKDPVEAYAWLHIAAVAGIPTAEEYDKKMRRDMGANGALLVLQRAKELEGQINSPNAAPTPSPGAGDIAGNSVDAILGKDAQGTGTGVFVSTDGLILTAAHVIRDSGSVKILTGSGIKSARILQVDKTNDVALLKCDGVFAAAPIAKSDDVVLGQHVYTIGFPDIRMQGLSPKLTSGEISSLAGLHDDPNEWQVSVPVQPGNSGGPLFNDSGEVVGLMVSKLSATTAVEYSGNLPEDVNYAVKSACFQPLLASYSQSLASGAGADPKPGNIIQERQHSVVLILSY